MILADVPWEALIGAILFVLGGIGTAFKLLWDYIKKVGEEKQTEINALRKEGVDARAACDKKTDALLLEVGQLRGAIGIAEALKDVPSQLSRLEDSVDELSKSVIEAIGNDSA